MIIMEDPVRKIGFALLERTERSLGWDHSVLGGDQNQFFFSKIKILELLEAGIYSENLGSYFLDCR